jgi:hypothetical protein
MSENGLGNFGGEFDHAVDGDGDHDLAAEHDLTDAGRAGGHQTADRRRQLRTRLSQRQLVTDGLQARLIGFGGGEAGLGGGHARGHRQLRGTLEADGLRRHRALGGERLQTGDAARGFGGFGFGFDNLRRHLRARRRRPRHVGNMLRVTQTDIGVIEHGDELAGLDLIANLDRQTLDPATGALDRRHRFIAGREGPRQRGPLLNRRRPHGGDGHRQT